MLSVLLHIGVVVGVFLFTFLKPPDKPKEMVFELVAPPPSSPSQPSESPEMDFSAPAEPIPIPRPQVPPPKPKPPEPKPEPPKPKPPEPKPVPAPPKPKPPEPKPVEQLKPMTIEEFRKANPQKQKQKSATPPKPRPVNVPRVDTKFNPNLRESVVNVDSLTGLSTIQQSELQSYIARLRGALELSWAKPGGLAQSLFTEVDFHVSPAGALNRIRIIRASGNVEFDGSVLDAFDGLGTAGATPNGKPLHLRLTFRMNEG